MANQTVGGVKELRVDDLVFHVGDSVTIEKNNITRESVVGATGWVGNKKTHKACAIEFQMVHKGNLSLDAIADKEDCTVSVICTNRIYVLRNACFVGDQSFDAIEGRLTIRFEGPEIKEI